MVATTTEILTVDGTNLKTLAKNVSSLAATLRAPSRRGANPVAAGRSGSIYARNKPHEEADYVWDMWVKGSDDDGAIPGGSTSRREFYKRVDELTRMFAKEHGLLDVRHTLPDGTIRQAFLECSAAIDFTTQAINPIGLFKVNLINPGVYWQDTTATIATGNQNPSTTVTSGAGATAPLDDGVFVITGPISNPKILDLVTGDSYFQYNATIPAGVTMTVNCGTWSVTLSSGTVDYTKVAFKFTNGRLLRLLPDPTGLGYSMNLTGTGTTAATKISLSGRRKFLVG